MELQEEAPENSSMPLGTAETKSNEVNQVTRWAGQKGEAKH